MPLVFDLTPTFVDADTPSSGSQSFGTAASQDMFEVAGTLTSLSFTEIYGEWSGSGFNYGALVVLTSPDASTYQSGSWYGANNNWGANGPALENHVKDQVISDSNPNGNEGINEGLYNPFPIPDPPPDPVEKIRDATRFKKAYSFARHQPVRIRIFRR